MTAGVRHYRFPGYHRVAPEAPWGHRARPVTKVEGSGGVHGPSHLFAGGEDHVVEKGLFFTVSRETDQSQLDKNV